MPGLVLWDIDNTLIDNSGVSKEIYAAAFRELTGQQARLPARTEGRTDPEILADLLRAHGMPTIPWPDVQAALTDAGLNHRQTLAERGRLMPGALDLVTALADLPELVQTVVTGNIRANADMKLAALKLLQWMDLDVGGYGSDSSDRCRLVVIARRRTCEKYGPDFATATATVVIGDTPRDVQAAREGGSRVLAVASGIHSERELRLAGADLVVPNLTETISALQMLTGTDIASLKRGTKGPL